MREISTDNFPELKNTDNKKFKINRKIVLEADMFYSPAFIGLSASAIRTLMRCLQKRKWVREKVNGKKQYVFKNEGFIFPYIEAAFLKIGTTTHWKNIISLIEKGFIDIVHQGGWYQKNEKEKDYSVYILSNRWKRYGTLEFEKKEKKPVLQKDFYIRQNLERQKAKATSQKRSEHLHDNEVDKAKHSNQRLHKSEVDETLERINRRLDSVI
jgi:hypothetical protein